METTRQQKVSRLIQRELGTWFQRNGVNYVPGGMITVTVVRVSPDLGLAKVYLSVFGTSDKLATVGRISENAWHVRHELAQVVRHQLRIVPELVFYLDDSLDQIARIDDLLRNG